MSFTQFPPTEFPVIERLRSVINGLRVTGQMTNEEILQTARETIPEVRDVSEGGEPRVRIEPVGRWLRELVTRPDTGEIY